MGILCAKSMISSELWFPFPNCASLLLIVQQLHADNILNMAGICLLDSTRKTYRYCVTYIELVQPHFIATPYQFCFRGY